MQQRFSDEDQQYTERWTLQGVERPYTGKLRARKQWKQWISTVGSTVFVVIVPFLLSIVSIVFILQEHFGTYQIFGIIRPYYQFLTIWTVLFSIALPLLYAILLARQYIHLMKTISAPTRSIFEGLAYIHQQVMSQRTPLVILLSIAHHMIISIFIYSFSHPIAKALDGGTLTRWTYTYIVYYLILVCINWFYYGRRVKTQPDDIVQE